MPTNDDYLQLRRKTGEVESDTYTDTELDIYIERAGGDIDLAASYVWGEKASAYADLVDISESGSSRKNSDLFKHAKEQQDYFEGVSGGGAVAADSGTSTTRRIVRM